MPDRRPRHDRRTSGVHPDEADLGLRLERALRDTHGEAHVDVAQLLRGTRAATTKRARVRRTAMFVATAAAVAAVPVGLQIAQWTTSATVRPGGGSPAPSTPVTSSPAPAPTPASSVPPSAPEPTGTRRIPPTLDGAGPGKTLYPIPDAVAFSLDELPRPMVRLLDLGQYRAIPTVQGQQCSAQRFARMPQPVAGRAWMWAEESSNRLDQMTVSLNVTGWGDEAASARELANVTKNSGACRFAETVTLVRIGENEWSAWGRRPDGAYTGYAAQRLSGGVVVAVSVDHPDDVKVALDTAESLASLAAERALDAGLAKPLPAAKGSTDPAALPGAGARPGTVTRDASGTG